MVSKIAWSWGLSGIIAVAPLLLLRHSREPPGGSQ